jgi:hypothetical protein
VLAVPAAVTHIAVTQPVQQHRRQCRDDDDQLDGSHDPQRGVRTHTALHAERRSDETLFAHNDGAVENAQTLLGKKWPQ